MSLISLDSDFQNRVIYQKFNDGSCLLTLQDLQNWKHEWNLELESWHSPWRSLIDFSALAKIDQSLKGPIELMMNWFKGIFLEEIAGFGLTQERGSDHIPFPIFVSFDEAATFLNILPHKRSRRAEYRGLRVSPYPKEGFLELSADHPLVMQTDEDLIGIELSLKKYLLKIHTPWSLVIDLSKLSFAGEALTNFVKLQKQLTYLFLREVAAYPKGRTSKGIYDFPVYATRHEALAHIPKPPADRRSCTGSLPALSLKT